MNLIAFLVSLLIVGAVFGFLGRLAIPGPNPMSIGMTILVGIAGSFVGGLVGSLLGASGAIIFVLEVLGAAAIVYLMQRRSGIRTH